MDTVTYPEQSVTDTINQRFVPLQVNTQEDWGKPIVERFRQVWTPDLRVLGPDGFEYSSWNGYLPPFEFLPRLLLGQAQARLRMNDEPGAAEVFSEVVSRFPSSNVAPEALYWLAVSRYKASHEGKDLMGGWHRVQTTYPSSIWRLKQSFIENKQRGE